MSETMQMIGLLCLALAAFLILMFIPTYYTVKNNDIKKAFLAMYPTPEHIHKPGGVMGEDYDEDLNATSKVLLNGVDISYLEEKRFELSRKYHPQIEMDLIELPSQSDNSSVLDRVNILSLEDAPLVRNTSSSGAGLGIGKEGLS